MNLIRIEDPEDPRVDVFSRFGDAELRRGWSSKGPVAQGPLFIAESRNVIERAMGAGVVPAALFADDKWLEKAKDLVDRVCGEFPGTPVYATSPELFKMITGYAQVRGILAAMRRPCVPDAAGLLAGAHRVAVLENVGNYTNVGAIFRSAAALGIDAVLVTPGCHDPLYRRAARVSMGTVFQVPWGYIGGEGDGGVGGEAPLGTGERSEAAASEKAAATPEAADVGIAVQNDWTATGIPLLRRAGFKTVALALTDDSLPIDDPRLRACDRLAMVLGTEGDGLASHTIASCDFTARIPMAHGVDSLNVAAASAVAFWELRRR